MWLLFALAQKVCLRLKSFGLFVLAEDISKEPSMYSAEWLLVFTLIQSYNESKSSRQGEMENVQFKKGTGSRMELSPVFKQTNSFEKKKIPTSNGIKEMVT